jgi:transposase InsO family protein
MSAPYDFRYYSPEFDSRTLDAWAVVKLEFSRSGKPTDNVYIESFNGRLRAECLNQHLVRDVLGSMGGDRDLLGGLQ